jgi:hypothetical protein
LDKLEVVARRQPMSVIKKIALLHVNKRLVEACGAPTPTLMQILLKNDFGNFLARASYGFFNF